jgi:hypothetical protein
MATGLNGPSMSKGVPPARQRASCAERSAGSVVLDVV